MGAIEKCTIGQDLYDRKAEAEDAQDEGKGRCVPAAWRYPLHGEIRAKPEGRCLSYEECDKKAQMSPDKAGKLAPDNGTRKQERLGTITITAKGVESNSSRIDHH